uniref:GCF C-terminal domain-containing protein n=1 Tax=Esox lucius TaxID=8010 RepID=A0A3P8ZUR5_ESOLU
MFKKAKRSNLRRRNESDEDEKEESQQVQPPLQQPCGPFGVDGPMPDAPSTDLFSGVSIDVHHGNGFQSKAIKKEKRTREVGGAPKASLLSFDDDEDETEVFRVKKSNHSKKIVKQLKKEYKEDLEKVYVKQEPNTGQIDKPSQLYMCGAGSEQGEEEMEVDSTEEQEEESKMLSHASKNPTTTASGAFSNTSTLSTLSNLRPGEIPDAAFIHAARKRRQMARELGGDAPLVETDAPKKRLVREEEQEGDGSDDEDEDEKRISFSGVKNKSQRSRIAEEIEGSDDDLFLSGHDEEVSRWEQEQIRKGISIPQVTYTLLPEVGVYYSSTYDAQPSYNTYSLPYSYSTAEDRAKTKVEGCPLAYSGPSGDLSPVTTELVKKRLRDRLSQMCVGHAANAKRYDQIQEELDAAQNTINRLEGSSNDNAEQYKFLQEMRGYVRDLLECFSEKVPCVSELEGAMHQLLKQRASRLVQRRRDDIKDESAEFASLSNKAVMAPNLMSPDSFGRDRTIHQEHVRQRRIAEREWFVLLLTLCLCVRTRRRQAREQNGKRAEHREGLSSDDEETSTDLTSYCLERDRIVRECKKVFEDVLEDFHSLDCIKGRFEVWRRLYFPCYRDAFIGLCLPKLFNPLVRLQLITWNPLQEKCANFEYMGWFESLLFYGCEEQSGMNRGDVDINLLPSIVERVLLPKLAVLADQVWDPLSSSQTARLVSFLSRLIKGYPTVLNGDNRNTQEFLKTIVLRTRRTLDDDVFLPLYPKNVLCNKNSGPYLFFQRQFWSCVKLLGNILQWNGVLSYSTLRELALDSTLNRYILSALQSSEPGPDSVLKCQRVVECLPASWFVGLKGQQTLPQLEPFCRYLSHMASSLLRGSLGGSDVEKRNGACVIMLHLSLPVMKDFHTLM